MILFKLQRAKVKFKRKISCGTSFIKKVVLYKLFASAMNFECYCHHTHPIIVECIGASSSSISKRVLQGNFPVMNAKSFAEALQANV